MIIKRPYDPPAPPLPPHIYQTINMTTVLFVVFEPLQKSLYWCCLQVNAREDNSFNPDYNLS